MSNSSQKAMVHVIGAGVAGLTAALELSRAGVPVRLYEASAQAGGRCRSYFDKPLGCDIDNGNHLIIKANHAVCQLIEELGTQAQFYPLQTHYPFYDCESGERWGISPPALPKGFTLRDSARLLHLLAAGPTQKLAQIFPPESPLFRSFIEPLCTATLNTRPEDASAAMFRKVLLAMSRPGAAQYYQVKTGFGPALIEPMLQAIEQAGGEIRYQKRVQALQMEAGRVRSFQLNDAEISLSPQDRVILATPPDITASLLNPSISLAHNKIVNGHFRYEGGVPEPTLMGVVGSPLQWLMVKPGLISTTTSDAEHSALHCLNSQQMAQILWRDVCSALQLGELPLPPHRILQEKRATIAATPENLANRIPAETGYSNLILAGDWLENALPATLESAVLSGRHAAALIKSLPLGHCCMAPVMSFPRKRESL